MRAAILALALAVGCRGNSSDDRLATSPEGYRVAWEGMPASAEALALFDAAMPTAEAHLAKYGLTPDQVRATAKSCRFNIRPGYKFQSNYSPTGWATGETSIKARVVELAWDTNPPSARHVPALGHELGHIVYGVKFEHGWTPPLK